MIRRLAVAALLVLLAHGLDLLWPVRAIVDLDVHDPGRLLRVVGHWPTWGLLALALGLQDRGRGRAWPLALSAGTAGLLAEMAQLLIQRDRPLGPGAWRHVSRPPTRVHRPLGTGAWHLRGWAERSWSTADLGMPSSHAAVAFGGAVLLGRLHPRIRPVVLGLAAGCALSRVVVGAHFPSDVVAGAAIGWLVAAAIPLGGERAV